MIKTGSICIAARKKTRIVTKKITRWRLILIHRCSYQLPIPTLARTETVYVERIVILEEETNNTRRNRSYMLTINFVACIDIVTALITDGMIALAW